MTNETFIANVRAELESMKCRSAWDRGVNEYANGFADDLEEWLDGNYIELDDMRNPKRLEKILLNGAHDWNQYSWGGCALCYDGAIAKRFCTPSQLKRYEDGAKQPSAKENWLDVQAVACYSAYMRISKAIKAVWRKEREQEPQSDGVKKLAVELGRLLLPRY